MASDSSMLHLGTLERRASVLPLVYLSVLDHYLRRNEGQKRVIGALLGSVKGLTVNVTNCFPVPHEEDGECKMDMDHLKSMLDLYRMVNKQEVIVGWYATGTDITENSVNIHEVFASNFNADAIHLLVDTELTNGLASVTAVTGNSMGAPGATQGKLFSPIECSVLVPEPERVALNLLDRNLSQATNTASLISNLDHVSEATDNLLGMITKALDYVEKTVENGGKGDANVGRALRDTIAAVPKVDPAQFEAMFNDTVQDMLMVVYLANLTQQQTALQDKLNEVL